MACFQRALELATLKSAAGNNQQQQSSGAVTEDDSELADIWFNIGTVAVWSGDLRWAEQCFTLAVTAGGTVGHPEAANNLAVCALFIIIPSLYVVEVYIDHTIRWLRCG